MSGIGADLRRARRLWRGNGSLAAVVVVTLALGVGANTAVFSFVWGILLRPFPYPAPDDLVRVFSVSRAEGDRESGSSLLDVTDWSREARTLVDVGVYTTFDSDLRGDGPAQPVRMCQLSAGALRAVGVQPALGRLFLPEEDREGGDVHKALISHGLWQRRFGGDPEVVGRTIHTALTTLTVVGVMPPGFGFPDRADVWTPVESWYAIQIGERGRKVRNHRFYPVIGRLRPGVTPAQAEDDLRAVAASLERRFPVENRGVGVRLRTLRETETGTLAPSLAMVAGAAVLVLLICCFNVAGLLLSRAFAVRRDFAVRAALGASRLRLLQASLAESALLALLGGVLGIGLAHAGVGALLRLVPVALPTWMRIEVDLSALGFALVLSLVATGLAGSAAAVMSARADVASVLRNGSRSVTGGGARLRSALVVSQIGLTLLLLVAAGLLAQTFLRLRDQETGFRTDGLLVVRATNYRSGTRLQRAAILSQFHEQVLERLRRLPGVLSAAGTNSMPYTRADGDRTRAPLRVKGASEDETRVSLPLSGADVTPGLLETMGIPLVAGRDLDARDTAESPMVVLVNQRAAERFWPGRDPIGQEIYWGVDDPSPENPYCRVVGVAGNVRHLAGEADDGLEFYYPYTQYPLANIYYVVRTSGDPERLAASAVEAVHSVDRNAAVVFVKTMDALIDESLWQRRLWSVLLGAFGVLSLTLVAVGLYGLLSHMVALETREIGVRIALGAPPRSIVRGVLLRGGKVLAGGVLLGLAAGVALKRSLDTLVFGLSAADPGNLVAACLVLLAVAAIACYLPARRASAVDPIVVLRGE